MSRRNRVRCIGVIAVAVGLAAAAAGQERSALDEVEREGRAPEVETLVLRFVHIPAESFVDTLEQLARNPKVRRWLEEMPLAVNEPANAVVLIAPPKVADMLHDMADQLDQPNEFLVHEREREAEEMAWRMEMEEGERDLDREQEEFDLEMDRRRLALEREKAAARRRLEQMNRPLARPPAPPPPPGAADRPRGPRCEPWCRCPHRGTPRCRDGRPARRRDADRPGPSARRRGPENGPPHRRPAPRRGPMGRLLDPRGHEALGLSDEQVEQIGDLVHRLRRHVEETWEGIRDTLRRAGPENREHILRELKEKMAGRWREQRRHVMDRLAEILNPDQRERLKEWMHEGGPGKRSGRLQPAPPARPPHRRHRDREGSHHPAEERQTPPCRLL